MIFILVLLIHENNQLFIIKTDMCFYNILGMNMKKILAILTMMTLTACTTITTSFDYDTKSNFTQLKTYAWVGNIAKNSPYHLDGLMDQRVRSAINIQMKAKGFTLAEAKDADVLVNYLTKLNKKIDVDSFNSSFGYRPYGYGWGGWGGIGYNDINVTTRHEGSLTVDIINNKSKKLIWRGTAESNIDKMKTSESKDEKISESITALFNNYPPKKAN